MRCERLLNELTDEVKTKTSKLLIARQTLSQGKSHSCISFSVPRIPRIPQVPRLVQTVKKKRVSQLTYLSMMHNTFYTYMGRKFDRHNSQRQPILDIPFLCLCSFFLVFVCPLLAEPSCSQLSQCLKKKQEKFDIRPSIST